MSKRRGPKGFSPHLLCPCDGLMGVEGGNRIMKRKRMSCLTALHLTLAVWWAVAGDSLTPMVLRWKCGRVIFIGGGEWMCALARSPPLQGGNGLGI